MDILKMLKFIKQIELPNNETFLIVGYDDEKYLYVREYYWQQTVKDIKMDFNGKILDEHLYKPEYGEGYALTEGEAEHLAKEEFIKNKDLFKTENIPFFAKYSFSKVPREEPLDLTETIHHKKSIFKEGSSYEKGKTFYHPAENEKKWLLDYFKKHKEDYLKWLNPGAFIGIFSDKIISKIKLNDSLFLSCRQLHCAVQRIDAHIKPNDKVYPYFWISFLEIGNLTLNPLKYEVLHRFPEGINEREFNSPGKIIQIKGKVLIKDDGQNRTKDRIHILEIQK